MSQTSLNIDHLNLIIKFFAVEINKRIKQLESASRPTKVKFSQTLHSQLEKQKQNDKLNSLSNNQFGLTQIKQTLQIYQDYSPIYEIEAEYIRKMVYRILQIFGFYKWKCRNQSILNHVQRQLTSKLHILINENPINVGKIMNYIVAISTKQLVSTKTGYFGSIPKTTVAASSLVKSRKKLFSRSDTKQLKQTNSSNHLQITTTACDLSTKKRTSSVMCSYNPNYVHPTVEVLDKLYKGMNIDKIYLSRCIQSENYLARDQTKRNKPAFRTIQITSSKMLEQRSRSIQNSTKKIKTETTQIIDNLNVLSEIKINTKVIELVSNFCVEGEDKQSTAKAPVMNLSSFARKRTKVKTACWKKRERKNFCNQNNFI